MVVVVALAEASQEEVAGSVPGASPPRVASISDKLHTVTKVITPPMRVATIPRTIAKRTFTRKARGGHMGASLIKRHLAAKKTGLQGRIGLPLGRRRQRLSGIGS